jgi:hypothetical protein
MPVPLRSDFDAAALCALARKSKDGAQARRLLALPPFTREQVGPRRLGSAA